MVNSLLRPFTYVEILVVTSAHSPTSEEGSENKIKLLPMSLNFLPVIRYVDKVCMSVVHIVCEIG